MTVYGIKTPGAGLWTKLFSTEELATAALAEDKEILNTLGFYPKVVAITVDEDLQPPESTIARAARKHAGL